MTTTVLLATALWHGLAAWHFGVTPGRTLGRTTSARPVEAIPTELFRFLAGLNLALVVLAGLAAWSAAPEVVRTAAITLAIANGSQLAQDLRVARLGLVRGPMFRTILVGDAVFTVLNAWIALPL